FTTGQTKGGLFFPVVGNVYENPGSSQFISKLSPGLDSLLLSTVFGSGRDEPDLSPSAFLVDRCGYVYFSGWGGDVNFSGSTRDLPISDSAFQKTTDGSDFYLAVFRNDLNKLIYSSYFGGGTSDEHVDGGTSRFDRKGVVYQSVCAGCGGFSDFPTTEGAWSRVNRGKRPDNPEQGGCNNALFKMDLGITNPDFKVKIDTCNFYVEFINTSLNSFGNLWDFGNPDDIQDTSTMADPSYSYSRPGTYYVRLIINSNSSCADTLIRAVIIERYTAPDFAYSIDTCRLTVSFNDISSSRSRDYRWDFGDGRYITGIATPQHKYAKTGNYNVRMILNYGFPCADTITQRVTLASKNKADLFIPNIITANGDSRNDYFYIGGADSQCEDYTISIYNRWGELIYKETGQGLQWDGTKRGGRPLTDGVYYYVFDSAVYGKFAGTVTLIH
ncbi:MAG: gliding motility-associated C-terminal domain-containing protein, partial [Bacteroidota bacterium]|nr:gliding motility-associated C-terminal domain-containing protein [Bacteroidota bacterium]